MTDVIFYISAARHSYEDKEYEGVEIDTTATTTDGIVMFIKIFITPNGLKYLLNNINKEINTVVSSIILNNNECSIEYENGIITINSGTSTYLELSKSASDALVERLKKFN